MHKNLLRALLAAALLPLAGIASCGTVQLPRQVTVVPATSIISPPTTVPVVDPARKDETVIDKTMHDLNTTTSSPRAGRLPETS